MVAESNGLVFLSSCFSNGLADFKSKALYFKKIIHLLSSFHSIALMTGLICVFFTRKLDSTTRIVFVITFLSTLSHSVFDALTNRGLGVAFFWPVSSERYFFPFHPV